MRSIATGVALLNPAAGAAPQALAGVTATLAVVLGVRENIRHLRNYYMPDLQRHVTRILWMVPIYVSRY